MSTYVLGTIPRPLCEAANLTIPATLHVRYLLRTQKNAKKINYRSNLKLFLKVETPG